MAGLDEFFLFAGANLLVLADSDSSITLCSYSLYIAQNPRPHEKPVNEIRSTSPQPIRSPTDRYSRLAGISGLAWMKSCA